MLVVVFNSRAPPFAAQLLPVIWVWVGCLLFGCYFFVCFGVLELCFFIGWFVCVFMCGFCCLGGVVLLGGFCDWGLVYLIVPHGMCFFGGCVSLYKRLAF